MPIKHKIIYNGPDGNGQKPDQWNAELVYPNTQRGNVGRNQHEFVPYAIPIGKLVAPPMGILVDSGRSHTRDRVQRAVASKEKPYVVTERDIVLTTRDLLKQPVTLPDDLFARLFPKGALPQQKDIGNCWAIAALTVTRNYPYFKAIIQRSMRKVYQDGKATGWAVRIPLGNELGKEIHVQKSELSEDGMEATLGFHILHAVIAKHEAKRKENAGIPLHRGDGKLNLSRLMKGGQASRALVYLFGAGAHESSIGRDHRVSLKHANEKTRIKAVQYLANFSPQYDVATFSTPSSENEDKKFGLRGVDETFLHNHAYAIRAVNPARMTVTVQDPNSEETCTLSWEQAFKIFGRIDRIEVFSAHRRGQEVKRRA